jgi:hypothetical protein
MATRKKKTETPQVPPEPTFTLQEFENKYLEGQEAGQQAVYKIVTDFVAQRMISHFEAKNDELAKELREIYLLIKENIKNP